METFRVQIEGLDKLQDAIKSSSDPKRFTRAVGIAAQNLHSALESYIVQNYTVDKRLSSVLKNRSFSNFTFGRNFLKNSLEYKDIPILLQHYAYKVESEEVDSSYPLRYMGMNGGKEKFSYFQRDLAIPGGAVYAKAKFSANVVEVAIERGKYAKYYSRYKQPVFQMVKKGQLLNRLFTRKQFNTWSIWPTKEQGGVRSPVVQSYGPSLSFLASEALASPEIQRKIDFIQTATIYRIMDEF